MGLTVNTGKLRIEPFAKTRSDVCHAWPIVVNHQMQRHLLLPGNARRCKPTKAMRDRQDTFEIKALDYS